MSDQSLNKVVLDGNTSRDLSTLLLPMVGRTLLVPNVSVAEIMEYMPATPCDGVPDWYMGTLSWRTTQIPLVSYEKMNVTEFNLSGAEKRIAVFNGINNSGKLPFWGMVTQGIPRQMRVMSEELRWNEEIQVGVADRDGVLVNGEQAIIPDLDFIEEQIISCL
jgi:chemosensory pili system protein ChpC